MKFLSNLKISIKLWSIISVALLGLLIVSVTSVYDIQKIQDEIHQIASEDIPLTKMITKITEHQLELGILLERSLRHGMNLGKSEHSDEGYAEAKHEFEVLGKKVAKEMKEGEALIKENISISHDEENTQYLTGLLDTHTKIESEAIVYQKHVEEVFHLFESGNLTEAIKEGELAEKEELKLIHELEAFLDRVSDNTKKRTLITEQDAESAFFVVLVISIAVFTVTVTGAYFVVSGIINPMKQMLDAANDLRAGDGDLTQRLPAFGKDEIGMTAEAFNGFIERMQKVLIEVQTSVENMSHATNQVNATAQSLSQGASEQASSLEETSASLEQMSASIDQNAENSKSTNSIANGAAQEASEGGKAVSNTVSAMSQIAEKISLIEDIAYKTNLLALNAAIEAARAGEHGKGFAVVADEVRKLAERSQSSAQEINELSSNSVQVAENAGALLEGLVPNISKTADLVQEISAATDEQSTGVTQINAAIRQLDSVSQQNAAASEELAATASELDGQAGELKTLIGYFKLNSEVA